MILNLRKLYSKYCNKKTHTYSAKTMAIKRTYQGLASRAGATTVACARTLTAVSETS